MCLFHFYYCYVFSCRGAKSPALIYFCYVHFYYCYVMHSFIHLVPVDLRGSLRIAYFEELDLEVWLFFLLSVKKECVVIILVIEDFLIGRTLSPAFAFLLCGTTFLIYSWGPTTHESVPIICNQMQLNSFLSHLNNFPILSHIFFSLFLLGSLMYNCTIQHFSAIFTNWILVKTHCLNSWFFIFYAPSLKL